MAKRAKYRWRDARSRAQTAPRLGKRKRTEELTRSPGSFRARYPGTCVVCGRDFDKGALIRREPRVGYRHDGC